MLKPFADHTDRQSVVTNVDRGSTLKIHRNQIVFLIHLSPMAGIVEQRQIARSKRLGKPIAGFIELPLGSVIESRNVKLKPLQSCGYVACVVDGVSERGVLVI